MGDKSLSQFAEEMIQILPVFLKGMLRDRKDVLATGKISVPQFVLLNLVSHFNKMKMNEIARHLKVSLPAATGLVDRLVGMDMIERSGDEKDRRVIYISLTQKGSQILKKVMDTRKQAITEIFGNLTDEERTAYLQIIKKLVMIMKEQENEK